MAYDQKKAKAYNQLIQNGVSEEEAARQAGIGPEDEFNYSIGDNGQIGPLIVGSGARNNEVIVTDQLPRSTYPQTAAKQVTAITESTAQTNSTGAVSGGGTTTIISGQPTAGPTTAAAQANASAAQAELDQFIKDNPSNFARKRQGLPPLTPAENEAREEQRRALEDQVSNANNQVTESKIPGAPTIIETPNTTTTTQTVETQNSVENTPVPYTSDPDLENKYETEAGNTAGNVESNSPPPVGDEDPFEAARLDAEARANEDGPTEADLEVDPYSDEAILALEQQQEFNRATLRAEEAPNPYPNGTAYDDDGNINPGWTLDEEGNPVYVGGGFVEPATQESAEESRQAASVLRAQSQQTLSSRVAIPSASDWRVRLSLAKGSTYLYNAAAGGSDAGILQPLYSTNGVVFPYTPSIEVNYAAKYDPYDLVHSNYRGYFYRSSSVGEIQLKGTFTAQDTTEANYLLAVIHFFRSVTKMFYGQDAQAGTPPPLVYLSGFGQNQFNNHSCVVSNFGYSLPTDVDYIRAGAINNIGFNLENRRDQSSGPGLSGSLGTVSRLLNNLLSVGALPGKGPQSNVGQNVNNTTPTNSTYVPTKMEISVTLLPIQTRSQVSKQFSLKGFANGDLLKKGFW